MTERLLKSTELSLPEELDPFVAGARVYDCSSSEPSKTYKVHRVGEVLYCKVGPRGLLDREVQMNRFFARFGLGPKVVYSLTAGELGYLVTGSLEGTDGIDPGVLTQPDRLAHTFGVALAKVHALPPAECPFPERTREMLDQAKTNLRNAVFADYLIPEGLLPGREKFNRLVELACTDAVIHGDYCLPNIILKEGELVGFVDLGNGGYGDSHHDLFWGLWTLEYNLKTDRYNDVFLAAYGRDRVDPDRIELNRLLSGFMD